MTPAFGFLGEYGFAPTELRAGDWWKISAVYRAERAAVEVVYSVELQRVEVNLTRAALLDLPTLSNGDVFVIGVPGQRGHLADRPLIRSYPDRKQRKKHQSRYRGLGPDRVASALESWTTGLREQAGDLLRGDLSILDEWDSPHGRLKVTVHLPRKATPRQEAAAIERTRAVLADAEVVAVRDPRGPDHTAGSGEHK